MKNAVMILLLATGSFLPAGSKAQLQTDSLSFKSPYIRYMGRIGYTATAAMLAWPGTTVETDFIGTGVSAWLQDEAADNYYHVLVDGKVTGTIRPTAARQKITLAEGLPAGRHTVQLFKKTEQGKTAFYGFVFPGTVTVRKPADGRHRIQFFGNSITCGRSVEDTTGKDGPDPVFENHYQTYAAMTARHFNADYHCVAKSGIGIMLSWFPLTMPEMYDRVDQYDSTHGWDFRRFTPELVVINLFQNDSWLVKKPTHPQFKRAFGNQPPAREQIVQAYTAFVKQVRARYPAAVIICCLGNMDATAKGSPWPGYIQDAVKATGDQRIHTLFFPYKNTPGHPLVHEQRAMADQLIAFIQTTLKW